MASQMKSTKYSVKISHLSSSNIPKNCRGRNASKLILWSQHHPDTKTRKKTSPKRKKKKIQTNITDEHRCKNPWFPEPPWDLPEGEFPLVLPQAIQEAGDARMACLIEALILFPCRIRVTSSYWAAKPSHYWRLSREEKQSPFPPIWKTAAPPDLLAQHPWYGAMEVL